MKKLSLALMFVASLAMLTACGGSGSSSSSSKGTTTNGLADGKWPASIYDKYGIPEIETQGKIVYTQFEDTEGSYQYEVYYNGVTKEEMQAYVKKLQDKGFRNDKYTQERFDAGRSDYDAFIFQPGEQKDKRLRLQYDFVNPMAFEYYSDEKNPAYVIVTRGEGDDEQDVIEYNFTVSLSPINNKVVTEGSFDALGLKAEDLAGIPNVRVVNMSSGATGGSIVMNFFPDHILTDADVEALFNKVTDVLEAKGATFTHALSGKDYTGEQLKAEKIRSFGVKNGDNKYVMMNVSDSRVGDFGGSVQHRFMQSRN